MAKRRWICCAECSEALAELREELGEVRQQVADHLNEPQQTLTLPVNDTLSENMGEIEES